MPALQGIPLPADDPSVSLEHAEPTWFDDDVVEPDAAGLDHVVVRLGPGRYGVEAVRVVEVVPVPALTRLPAAPAWVRGVGNWRGRVLPVVDLRPLLGVAATPLASSARVVVLRSDETEVGVVADAVQGLLEVPEDHEPPPVTLAGDSAELVRGLADESSPYGPVALLDADAVLRLGRRVARGR
jgi:chemotaxis signal transduction protein